MDSSSVATFARRHWPGPIHSFAFRCAGASYDESVYARALASELRTEHSEVEYGEREALQKREIVAAMDVPFCDVGINVGTWILGREARKHVSYVLTGDGGDEIWGSHPVYAAQRLMRIYDRLPLPRALQGWLVAAAARLPDSDQKRDLRVKLKRFLPRAELPRALGHFRWRAYYAGNDLETLLTPEAARLVKGCDPYASVLAAFDGYDGPDDGLSALLYNDYRTASSFYFSRLGLIRSFGVEARSPFYDRALVEYGARIPARLKLEGIERTKRLFRVAMEGILADVINHRTDKLGHSVPLKNWLRQSGAVFEWVSSMLSAPRVNARGLFRTQAIERMLQEHRERRHDHSHRLWALAVLESWLSAQAAEERGS
jgi:asparagine synthase (glutamine-hydrolysing)